MDCRTTGRGVSGAEVARATQRELRRFSSQFGLASSFALVETAGGVASPGPCGRLQHDILRPLRLPGVLVGDGRLGGISATITALESLLLRGCATKINTMILTKISPFGHSGCGRPLRGMRCSHYSIDE
jgi:dethiobiotin synthetase